MHGEVLYNNQESGHSEFLEDETDKSECEDNVRNEGSQANSINGKVDESVASVAQIIASDEESNTCDCSKVKSHLLNVKVAEGVVNLCENMSQNSTAKVTISSIISRADNEEFHKKVTEYNKTLKSFAKDRNWGFVDNSKISKNYLNIKGVHLNANGTAALGKNITSYLYNSH